MGKALEKMRKNDVKAWETSSEREERYFDTPREKKKSPRHHKLDKFKPDIRW